MMNYIGGNFKFKPEYVEMYKIFSIDGGGGEGERKVFFFNY